jgi:FKBP-type peptidyl-prolyl cis-trans isomerase SlyD
MKAQIVSFHCVLKTKVGQVISSTFNRDVITHIEKPGTLLKSLAEQLQDLKKGDKRIVFLTAEEAYGFYNPDLVVEISRKTLTQADALQVGYQILSPSKDGGVKAFQVVKIDRNWITLDGNHPLAGQDLIFEIETIETRDATSDEIAASSFKDSSPYFH